VAYTGRAGITATRREFKAIGLTRLTLGPAQKGWIRPARYWHAAELPKTWAERDALLWASISYDIDRIAPRAATPSIYFIDFTQRIAFHVNGDLFGDFAAMSPEPLRPFYEKHHKWLRQANRAQMDEMFGGR
jgi:hypothetical protein